MLRSSGMNKYLYFLIFKQTESCVLISLMNKLVGSENRAFLIEILVNSYC